MNITDFKKMKKRDNKITMITCYDYLSAKIANQTEVDCILVGDSLAMVMHGHANTITASVDLMTLHIQAVALGAKNKFIIGDMPFLTYRKDLLSTMNVVEKIIQAGAHAVKLEGFAGNEKTIKHIVESGIPVMGHLGLIPQSINLFGGYHQQGQEKQAATTLLSEAMKLQKCGCFAIVLECIPPELAKKITTRLTIPTIGIGAGPHVSGQVLVWHDLLGMNPDFKAKHVKTYLDGFGLIKNALNKFNHEVKNKIFPI